MADNRRLDPAGHIRFEELEAGDPVDSEHIAACAECSRQGEIHRLLRFQLDQIPEVHVPPFFASRIAHRIVTRRESLAEMLERTARKLVPVLWVLLLVISAAIYFAPQVSVEPPEELAIFPEESTPQEVTLSDVVDLLQGGSGFEED